MPGDPGPRMVSERLRYRPVEVTDVDAFHRLVQDEHVRRYLMDGTVFPREWSADRMRDSEAGFEARGLGLWLVHDRTTDELVGFCGFLVLPSIHPEPQLVYAMLEQFSGKAYATEMARVSIAHARKQAGVTEIFTSVDEINAASLRVLEKLEFERIGTQTGSFGNMFLMRRGGETCGLR